MHILHRWPSKDFLFCVIAIPANFTRRAKIMTSVSSTIVRYVDTRMWHKAVVVIRIGL